MTKTVVIDESTTIHTDRVRITFTAEPLEVELDAAAIVSGPARALRDAIAEGIRAIAVSIAPATKVYREKAARALKRGAPWAVARFGTRTPGASDRLFNDSGALADSLSVDQDGKGYDVGTTRDLEPPGAGSLYERLIQLVPALRDPFSSSRVNRALESAFDAMFSLRRR
jgi:hypothetical protein